ncbi:MAG: hypothetical protein Q8Q36_01070 [bacterium]|nr:hypothetical protein [bacterium]
MSLESGNFSQEKSKIEVEKEYESFVPKDFKENPIDYFEKHGSNIKSGKITYKDSGEIEEDPTAVKDFPVWKNDAGEELFAVGKKVNLSKSQIEKSNDPFYEYRVMRIAQEFNLPGARPIAKAEKDGTHLIVMEKIRGLRWTDKDALFIKEKGYTKEDVERLTTEAEIMMENLRQKYESIGLHRTWKVKDMVFDLDIENKVLRSITPTDWERTTIDSDKLDKARRVRA